MAPDANVARQFEERLAAAMPAQQNIVGELRTLVHEIVPGASEKLNPWNIPTFDYHGDLCYFTFSSKHITFGFLRGGQLDDPRRLLEGTG